MNHAENRSLEEAINEEPDHTDPNSYTIEETSILTFNPEEDYDLSARQAPATDTNTTTVPLKVITPERLYDDDQLSRTVSN